MTTRECIKKQILLTKFHVVKAMVFPVVMYEFKSWTIKKAEHRRTDAFELWYWRRLLRVPWTTRRSNQSILEEIKKTGLKLNIQKTNMVSVPIPSCQIDEEIMETVTDFIFLGSKITADGDCSHKIKRHLLLGRKAMPNLDSILKSRNITLPIKVCLVKAMVFPVVCMDVRIGL